MQNLAAMQKQMQTMQIELERLKSLISTLFGSEAELEALLAKQTPPKTVHLKLNQNWQIDLNGGIRLGVAQNKVTQVGQDATLLVNEDSHIDVKKNSYYLSGKDMTISAGKNILISAADRLTLQSGQASIVLSKNGDISINANKLELLAKTKVLLKSAGELILKGNKIKDN